jgi:hypothetical protein
MIREMCRNRYAEQTMEEVEVRAIMLAQLHAEEKMGAFKREGVVAE